MDGGGTVWISPGRKKLAGETVWLPLMPPQPAAPATTAPPPKPATNK